MAAQRRDEEQRTDRRRQLVRGLALGAAAIGLPALVNRLVTRHAERLPLIHWGHGTTWDWRGCTVAYRKLGEGDTVVILLHSLGPGHHAIEWRRTAERLARDYQVVVPDLPGWGQSASPAGRPSPSLYIDFLKAFGETVIGRPAVIVAAGISAAYAVEVAVSDPERVRALALIGPRGLETSTPTWRDRLLYQLLRTPILGTSALNIATSRTAITRYLRRQVYGDPSVASPSLIERVYRSAHRPEGRSALAALLAGLLDHDVSGVIGDTGQPLWLAWGRRSLAPPVENADLWLRHRPDAFLEVIERCGVLPHEESPVETSQKLEDFLRRVANEPRTDGP